MRCKVSIPKVEKVVKEPMNPIEIKVRVCLCEGKAFSARPKTIPARKHPIRFINKVPSGKLCVGRDFSQRYMRYLEIAPRDPAKPMSNMSMKLLL